MKHIQHTSNNGVLGAPRGVSHDDCKTLPVTHVKYNDDTRAVMSFWQPTDAEKAAIMRGEPVCLSVWGTTHAPVFVGVGHPFIED